MTKRPAKIKVACFDIDVIDFTQHEATLLARFGEFSALENRIRIDPAINKIKGIDTLLHELSHAIYWAYGIEDEDKEEGKEEAEREARERDWRDREIAASGVLRDAIGDERDEDYIDACAVGLIDTRDGIMRERDPERWAEMRAGAG